MTAHTPAAPMVMVATTVSAVAAAGLGLFALTAAPPSPLPSTERLAPDPVDKTLMAAAGEDEEEGERGSRVVV